MLSQINSSPQIIYELDRPRNDRKIPKIVYSIQLLSNHMPLLKL